MKRTVAQWSTSRGARAERKYETQVSDVLAYESRVRQLSDEDLRGHTGKFVSRLRGGESEQSLLPEAFATVREAARRVLGKEPYPVQLLAGAALHAGNIVEMKTGEGKTLACILPAYLSALRGDGVHISTANPYLAERDADMMGRVYHFLGLTTGLILPHHTIAQRRSAYSAHITYSTATEYAFDYLRDNMAEDAEGTVQRWRSCAIIDEADAALVDESRTPLIISGPDDTDDVPHRQLAALVADWVAGVHYTVDEVLHTVAVEEPGVAEAETALDVTQLHVPQYTHLVSGLHNAVKAVALYERDKDYLVDSGEVTIVDTNTGRTLTGRRYSGGLHQALEAKEGLTVRQENRTLATTTMQGYYKLYRSLSGTTGTTAGISAELADVYGVAVFSVPTNYPSQRVDLPNRLFTTETAKVEAVADDVLARTEAGQPVLIGTGSVAASNEVAEELRRRGLAPQVLNAANPEQEAVIVAKAGVPGAVTVATNMAGRGTDIALGGTVDVLATERVGHDATDEQLRQARHQVGLEVAHDADAAVAVGGLCIIGTHLNTSVRLDEQLRGRAGRQGDPGETRYYLSLEDETLQRYGPVRLPAFTDRGGQHEIANPLPERFNKHFVEAQVNAEQEGRELRKQQRGYTEVIDAQRAVVYAERSKIVHRTHAPDAVLRMLTDTLADYVEAWYRTTDPDIAELHEAVLAVCPQLGDADVYRWDSAYSEIGADLLAAAEKAYRQRVEQIREAHGSDGWKTLEARVLLAAVDTGWRRHLEALESLRTSAPIRSGGKDPIVEYRSEAHQLYIVLLQGIRESAARALFTLPVVAPSQSVGAQEQVAPRVAEPNVVVRRGHKLGWAAAGAALVVAAGGWVAVASPSLSDSDEGESLAAPQTAAPPSDQPVENENCPESESDGVVIGAGPGGTSSGADAILAFDYGFYVHRSGEKARQVVAPDAQVPSAADIQAGIDPLPPETSHCLKITPQGPDHFAVELTQFAPGQDPETWPQVVHTSTVGDRTIITSIAAG